MSYDGTWTIPSSSCPEVVPVTRSVGIGQVYAEAARLAESDRPCPAVHIDVMPVGQVLAPDREGECALSDRDLPERHARAEQAVAGDRSAATVLPPDPAPVDQRRQHARTDLAEAVFGAEIVLPARRERQRDRSGSGAGVEVGIVGRDRQTVDRNE